MPGAYAKNSEKTARPKAECTAAAEKAVRGSPAKARRRAGKPRQSPPPGGATRQSPPPGGEAPPKRRRAGKPAKARRRAGKPRQSRRRAGKPRQSPPPCGEAPPKPAAVRGSPPKPPPCGEAPQKPADVRGSPAKVRRRAGKPRQSAAGQSNPPKPAAVRGSPAKPRRRAGKPRQSAPLRRTGRNIKKAAGRMTRRLRGLYSSACSKLTFLLLWLYNTVRMCRFCDETETLRLQLRTGLVKLLRCRFYLL